jgi:hypothetical protein
MTIHWKDTLIKAKNIKWKAGKLKWKDDGSWDLNIHIPLDMVLKRQAKYSFMAGVAETISWWGKCQGTGTKLDTPDIQKWLIERGCNELAEKLDKTNKDGKSETNE